MSAFVFVFGTAGAVERAEMEALVAAALKRVDSLDVFVEGECWNAPPNSSKLGVTARHTGRFVLNGDKRRIEDQGIAGERRTNHTYCYRDGERQFLSRHPDRKGGKLTISKSSRSEPMLECSYSRLFLLLHLRTLLRDPGCAFAESNPETIDGRETVVVALTNDGREEKFWVDRARDMSVLKHECRADGRLESRTTDIALASFQTGRAEPIWLPFKGVYDAYLSVDSKDVVSYSSTSTYRETVRVLDGRVRVNPTIDSAEFTIPRDPTYLVADQIRNKVTQPTVERMKPPTKEEAARIIDERLAKKIPAAASRSPLRPLPKVRR